MLLGDVILNALCDILGEGTYVILRQIVEEAKKELEDAELILYVLAFMYGIPLMDAGDKLKIKRQLACLDVSRLFPELEADENRVYIRKVDEQDVDKAMRVVIKAISSTLRSLLGDAARILIKTVARYLAKAFKGPNDAAIRVTSELSRNPYAPRITVEIKGNRIIVYSKYPFEISEAYIRGTFLPLAVAYAAAMMNGYDDVRLVDARLLDKNTIVLELEAVR